MPALQGFPSGTRRAGATCLAANPRSFACGFLAREINAYDLLSALPRVIQGMPQRS